MDADNKNPFEKIKPGTKCAKIFFTSLFFCVSLLFVLIGLWKTVFVLLLSAVGYFIGSSKDIKSDIAGIINKVTPQQKKVEPTEEDKQIYNRIKSSVEEIKEKLESNDDKSEEQEKSEDKTDNKAE
ncbi:MAG: DUF2273 domain-containing protein [Eubacteriales bacterium]|nr:DUF2273 domain-containing protein [Eubacteriales bacterium]